MNGFSLRTTVLIGIGAFVGFKLVEKMIFKQPAAGEVVALADTSGRSIQLTEKNGYLRDQFGGLWI